MSLVLPNQLTREEVKQPSLDASTGQQILVLAVGTLLGVGIPLVAFICSIVLAG